MAVQNQITFKKGERLSAQKMNALANLAMNINSPTYARPDGMGFHGETKWQQKGIDVQDVPNKPRFKPFDICPQWDASGKLSAYVVMRPMWQVFEDNEAKVLELSDDVQLTHEGGMDSVSAIYLVQLSAEEDSASEGEGGEGEESEDEGDWKVLDNVGLQEEDRTIQNKWLLYKVGGNGLVTLDVRDAFVNLQLSSDVSSDASVELDLSSLNYDDESKIQNWNYKEPVAEDLIDLEISAMGGYRFLTRPEEGGSLKYASLSAAFNDLSSDISALSARTGECSCEMSAVIGAETYVDNAYRTNTKIAQFKDCHNNTTDIYAPNKVRFAGNVPASQPTKTGWRDMFVLSAGLSSNVVITASGTQDIGIIQIGCYYL